MLRIVLVPWDEAREHAIPIRFAVFVEEQGVPSEIELDEHDAGSVHALAIDDTGRVIGTGRLLSDGHIGRMAVLRDWRGKGVGSAILERLMAAARGRGDREIILSAQTHVLEFYCRHGFTPQGDVYLEAGIPHQEMRRPLT